MMKEAKLYRKVVAQLCKDSRREEGRLDDERERL